MLDLGREGWKAEALPYPSHRRASGFLAQDFAETERKRRSAGVFPQVFAAVLLRLRPFSYCEVFLSC